MSYEFGPLPHDDGSATFRVWAPACEAVSVVVNHGERQAMVSRGNGFFELRATATAGDLYGFDPGNGMILPDPASRFQPDGVHGLSLLVDPGKRPAPFAGVARDDLVLYETHIGCFTEEGDYRSAAKRLPELAELGVTAVEIMPLAQCAGSRNWGYDGVDLYAPHFAYGTPADLLALVDTAHELGLAVILDVVYNHFGAEGNYLGLFGGYLSRAHTTPWGDAPNFDEEHGGTLRRFVLENIRYWIETFGFDGIRLDATHCINDRSDPHIVREIGETCRSLQETLGRPIHLIAESNVYDPELLLPLRDGGFGFDALWCDDFIHSVYAALAPGHHLSDRQYHPESDLELILRRGYVFHGTLTTRRERHLIEKYPHRVGVESIVAAIQNHDFIGNHPAGLRLHRATSPEAQRAAAALLLLSPSIPMLFMGEDFASPSPFYFFTDFGDPAIRRAVEEGRQAEHPQHDWNDAVSPLSEEAFTLSKIGPISSGDPELRSWYRALLEIRKTWRNEGFLDSERVEAEWRPRDKLALLRYRNPAGDPDRFVLVRLHPVDREPAPVAVRVDGDTLLRSHEDTAVAGRFAVIVGVGTVEISG